ncbi:heat shock factor protein 1 isoform X4 [Hydra vulgaris]|uniref:Heat shock factor protein 1 isoform X4 n=1 Tax=Hydra vulgaris TaxID=6087 RepID=A0ABM4DP79_HYDVU
MDEEHVSLKNDGSVPQGQPTIPAFLIKLWRIVEDPQFDHMISWHQNGKTFRVHDQAEFSKEILPKYYKHNNFSSFVRQVNMYGFRKIIDPKIGGLKNEKDQWEFFHPHFSKAAPDDLAKIKRKVHIKDDTKSMTLFVEDIERLKMQNDLVEEKFSIVKAENNLLWREISDLRERHKNQQAIINKLIQFFVNLVVGSGNQKIMKKRRAFDFLESSSAKVPKSQVLQPYNPQNAAFQQLFQDVESYESTSQEDTTPYTVTVPPEEDDQLLKLVSETTSAKIPLQQINTALVNGSAFQETSKQNSFNILLPSSSSKTPSYSNSKTIKITKVPNPSTNSDSVNKTSTKTIKIVPSDKPKSTAKHNNAKKTKVLEQNIPESFPISVKDLSEIKDEAILDLSYLENINTEAISIEDLSNITPTVLAAPLDNESLNSNQPTSLVKRQLSVADRETISQDVDQISKSLDVLQSMLDKNQLNLDLRNLQNVAYNQLPTQVSLLDLLQMNQRQSEIEDLIETEHDKKVLEEQGQLLPYTVPFSPSQLIDEDFSEENHIQEGLQSNLFDDDCGF